MIIFHSHKSQKTSIINENLTYLYGFVLSLARVNSNYLKRITRLENGCDIKMDRRTYASKNNRGITEGHMSLKTIEGQQRDNRGTYVSKNNISLNSRVTYVK